MADERNRMARELHDSLGHRLTVAAVQLEGAQRLIPADAEKASRMVGTVREQVREGLSELRRTVAALRVPLGAGLPLDQAIAQVCGRFGQATGMAVHLAPDAGPPLPEETRHALYRAAQEMLTNVQRHAQAGEVWIELHASDRRLSLAVSDNGVGLAQSDKGSGFGLRGLREGAAALGGELHLQPRSGGGTLVTLSLPAPSEEASA